MVGHRPSDWHVLDLDKDPTPGDPQRVRTLAKTLHDFADDVSEALRLVKGMAGESTLAEWAGKSATVFKDEFSGVPKNLRKLEKSYGMCGDALADFWPKLERAQALADRALVKAREARQDLSSAQSKLSSADSWVTRASKEADKYKDDPTGSKSDADKPDEAKVRAATRDVQHAKTAQTNAQSAVDSAQSALDAAKKMAEDARKMREDAAREAKNKIDEASDAGIQNRSWWEDIGDWFTDNWDNIVAVCKVVVAVVGIVAMIIGGPILGAIVLVAALVVLADTLYKYSKGQASLWDVGLAALDCIPGMKGLTTLGGLAKGLKTLGKTGLKGMAQGVRGLGRSLRGGAGNLVKRAKALAGRCPGGDPIDMVTGEMLMYDTDIELPGVLTLALKRTHLSTYREGRWFGRSWASTLDERVELDSQGVLFAAEDGMILAYPVPVPGVPCLPLEGPQWPLEWDGPGLGTLRIRDTALGVTRHFSVVTDPLPDMPYTLALSAITDRNDNRIDVARRSDGTPTAVRHSAGYHVEVETSNGLVSCLRLRHGAHTNDAMTVLRYSYSTDRNLTEIVNSSGLPFRLDYDDRARVVSWTDRNGSWYRFGYDNDDRCVTGRGAGGYLNCDVVYDPTRRVTMYTDSLGHVTRYEHNELLQLVGVTDPLGRRESLEWDRHGRLLKQIDPMGRETGYSYDEAGNVTSIVGPDGRRATAKYNQWHLPVVTVGGDGAVRTYTYDDRGNRTSVVEPGGATTSFTYGPGGAVTGITDPHGARVSVGTNDAGLPIRVTNPTGAFVEYTRDPFGRVDSVTDPLGGVTHVSWTPEGRKSRRTAADGSEESWVWDAEGNLLTYVDPSGATTTSTYSHFDLLKSRTDATGAVLDFEHDTELRLVAVTNAQGRTWRYTYDAAGHLIAEQDFDGRSLSYVRDEVGRLIKQINGAGETVEYLRDVVGNVVEKRSGDATTVFRYDDAGFLSEALSPEVHLTFAHDEYGRVTEESVNGRTSSFRYDLAGRRTTRVTPSGTESTWSYTADGQPHELLASGHTLRFFHDAAGRETEIRLGDGASLVQSWDALHRMRSQTVVRAGRGAPGATPIDRQYVHGPVGPLEVREGQGSRKRYTLDVAGRPDTVSAQGWSESYSYDRGGRLAASRREGAEGTDEERTRRFTYDGSRLTRAGRTSYAYDAQGRVIRRTRRTLSGLRRIWSYTWDSDDRLASIVTPDGTTWRYFYDPLGRRVAKERLDSCGEVDEAVFFVWDGSRLAEEIHERPSATGHRTTVTWEYTPDSHRAVAQCTREWLRDAPQDEVDRRFRLIVSDLAGSPAELLTEEGSVTWKNRSSLWGASGHAQTGEEDCRLRFPGQYFDPESELHYNHFRYYDPHTARYVSPDPLGLAAGPDHYAYVLNPLVWSDPLGLQTCPTFKGLAWLTDKMLKRPSFRYQRVVSGTDYEQIWKLSNGREVHVDGGPTNGWIMEAKFTGGRESEWAKSAYNPESSLYNETKITDQAAKLLKLNEELGGKGVRYAISNEAGAAHFREVLGTNFPEAMANGTLAVFHVPGNGMSGMSKWLT
ncbi:RHS repeat-associated core domain-containing protein [Streptomyces ardesiacus]|uniref:RHS repeat-associated core domain-containing protein n=1 Tax=Streptomyces ardesiacus TaxID=285564 RepID=UPI0006E3154D|nr:RHS repeat-associated core domain-containing protein [Streptomyces sp. NBRC 110030]